MLTYAPFEGERGFLYSTVTGHTPYSTVLLSESLLVLLSAVYSIYYQQLTKDLSIPWCLEMLIIALNDKFYKITWIAAKKTIDSFLSIAVVKLQPKATWEIVYFILDRLRSIVKGSQGRNLGTGTEAETAGGGELSTALLSLPSYPAQGWHPPKNH